MVKAHITKQHKKVMPSKPVKPAKPTMASQHVSGQPMLIFNMFLADILTRGLEIHGLLTPDKYMANTFGFYKAENCWYKLKLVRHDTIGNLGPWKHRWHPVNANEVPAEYRAKAMLLAASI